jgi:hypothetical protein
MEVGCEVEQLNQVFAGTRTEPYSLRVYPKPNHQLSPRYAQSVTIVELVVEVILNVVGSVLEQAVDVRGAGVTAVVNPSVMLGVIIGAEGDFPVVNCLKGAE